MFRKHQNSPSVSSTGPNDRQSVIASVRTSPAHHKPSPGQTRRPPDSSIGIAHLLEAYDDYPLVVQDLETTAAALRESEERAAKADEHRIAVQEELSQEKDGRAADAVAAEKAKKAAEEAREKKIRDELQPKIDKLQAELKTMTADRDKQKKDLAELRAKMSRWISPMEALDKERALAVEKEVKAAEERKKADEKLKELNATILDGLREASKLESDPAPSAAAAKAESTPSATVPATESEKTKVATETGRSDVASDWGKPKTAAATETPTPKSTPAREVAKTAKSTELSKPTSPTSPKKSTSTSKAKPTTHDQTLDDMIMQAKGR